MLIVHRRNPDRGYLKLTNSVRLQYELRAGRETVRVAIRPPGFLSRRDDGSTDPRGFRKDIKIA